MADSPIHFEGTIPNQSRTPRNEVGGIAVFGGVLMLSRTGFAIAVRRRNGCIVLRQIPFARFWRRRRKRHLPVLRGAFTHFDMMEIGTKGLRYSSSLLKDPDEEPEEIKPVRLALFLLSSSIALIGLLVFLPNLLAETMGIIGHWAGWISQGNLAWFQESESPFVFNLIAGVLRLVLLVGYVVGMSFDREIRRVFEYHGAEHKAVLALEEGGDVTVARARRHDTLHSRCGTTFLALASILAILAFPVVDWLLPFIFGDFFGRAFAERKTLQLLGHALSLPIVIGLSFEILKYCNRRSQHWLCRLALAPGFALQRLTTRQPDDKQLEVAIIALFGALDIPPHDRQIKTYVVRGLEDDESAPGFTPRSPARPAEHKEESGGHDGPPAPDNMLPSEG